MNAKNAKRYLATVQDKAGKYGLEHADGTPCDAKTPESCPHNKRAQKADDLSGSEDPHEKYKSLVHEELDARRKLDDKNMNFVLSMLSSCLDWDKMDRMFGKGEIEDEEFAPAYRYLTAKVRANRAVA